MFQPKTTQPNKKQSQPIQSQLTSESKLGLCGLQNLGNTCFMNVGIQCLSNTTELTNYFLNNNYLGDINEENPLGSGQIQLKYLQFVCLAGQLTQDYCRLIKELWYGKKNVIAPSDLKRIIGKLAKQFSGYAQQDAQEFLSYLLDGLHEDLNKINKEIQPQTEMVDDNQPDDKANSIWEAYKLRNNSIIIKLFYGQYKSTLTCPSCHNISIAFDPFNMLSVPIPDKALTQLTIYFIDCNENIVPVKIQLTVPQNMAVKELKEMISKNCKKRVGDLVVYLQRQLGLVDEFQDEFTVSEIQTAHGIPFIYEIKNQQGESQNSNNTNGMDIETDNNNNNNQQVLIKLSIYQETRSIFDLEKRISFPRLFIVERNITNEQLHLLIFQKFRFYLNMYATNAKSTKVINLNNGSSKEDIKQEYNTLFTGTDEIFYQLYIKNREETQQTTESFYAINSDIKISQFNCKELEIKLKFQPWVNLNFLGLNFCKDFHSEELQQHQEQQQLVTIYNCLDLFTEKEKLETKNSWFCSKCKSHKQARKKMELYKLPPILIIHFKRFKTHRTRQQTLKSDNQKLVTNISFPLEKLDLSKYILQKNEHLYDLFAVCNHEGGLGGGHYIAYAKNFKSGQWYEFNDTKVTQINESEIVNQNAYVLFYRQKDFQDQ